MRPSKRLVLSLALLAIVATGCDRREPGKDAASDLSEQRLILSQGYSMLYKDASSLGMANLVLFVKVESQAFEDVIKQLSEYGDELKAELERIARDYPGVRIDLEPLPEMETRKRFAIARDRALHFAPLAGASRLEYERTMLIATSNALNHEGHLCQVMAAEEPNPELKKVLLRCEERYAALYKMVMDTLNREHFSADSPDSSS